MALTNKKLDPGAYVHHSVTELPDNPGHAKMDAAILKARFDDIATQVIGPRINEIIDALMASTTGDSGAHNIGSATINGVAGNTVYEQITDMKAQMVNWQFGKVLENTIVDAQLENGGTNIKARFAAHRDSLGAHMLVGQTGGTSAAYTLTDPKYTWTGPSGISNGVALFLVRPHAACSANATMSICGGPALSITPSSGGGLVAEQMKADGMYLLMWNPTNSLLYVLNPEPKLPVIIVSSTTPAVVEGAIWLKII